MMGRFAVEHCLNGAASDAVVRLLVAPIAQRAADHARVMPILLRTQQRPLDRAFLFGWHVLGIVWVSMAMPHSGTSRRPWPLPVSFPSEDRA